jgi:hypothetical protein
MIHGCLPTVSHKFSMYSIQKLGNTLLFLENKKIVGVDNVEDNDEDVNQFEHKPLFINPMNIKHIEKDFDKNLSLYMRKGGKGKFLIIFSYMNNYVSHFILMLIFVCIELN